MANRETEDREAGRRPERPPFTVVIPALDEERGLLSTLDGLREVLNGSGRTYEIVVVDDGSRDATPRILGECGDVVAIRHPETRGYGAALKTGIKAAHHPLVVVMDADGTYPVAAIPSLVDHCATADMVVGARIGRNVHSTPARAVAKWAFRQFAQWITGTRIPDLNSGLRVFRRTVAEQFMELFPDGFSFTTTITVASLLERLHVRFEPVDYMPRIGRSKVRPIRDTLRIARQLLWLGTRLAPLRTSFALMVPLVVASAASLSYHLLRQSRIGLGDLTLFAAAFVVLAIGARAERRVQRRRGEAASDVVRPRRMAG